MKSDIQSLRTELLSLFAGLKAGKINPKVSKEMNNAAGKVIATAKVELEYEAAKQRNSGLVIPFLEGSK